MATGQKKRKENQIQSFGILDITQHPELRACGTIVMHPISFPPLLFAPYPRPRRRRVHQIIKLGFMPCLPDPRKDSLKEQKQMLQKVLAAATTVSQLG